MKKFMKFITIVIVISVTASLFMLAGCEKEEVAPKHLSEDKTFYLDKFDINLMGFELNPIQLNFLDLNNSFITLRANGTFTLKLAINNNMISVINSMIKGLNTSEMDINTFAEQYLYTFFPGFVLTDIPTSLNFLRNSLGAQFIGIDYESPEMMSLLTALAEGRLPESISLPANLAIQLDTVYEIVNVHSEYTGDYTGIYVGNWDHEESYEPYLILTMYENESGQSCLKTRLEVIGADINATANS